MENKFVFGFFYAFKWLLIVISSCNGDAYSVDSSILLASYSFCFVVDM